MIVGPQRSLAFGLSFPCFGGGGGGAKERKKAEGGLGGLEETSLPIPSFLFCSMCQSGWKKTRFESIV